jgi:phosphate transport system permease protein
MSEPDVNGTEMTGVGTTVAGTTALETTGQPTTHVVEPVLDDEGDVPRAVASRVRGGDRIFLNLLSGSGLTVLGIIGVIGAFLGSRAWQALHVAGWGFVTTQQWEPGDGASGPSSFGVAGVLTGTVLIGLCAIVLALPVAFGVALYISEYAPQRIKRLCISLVDLMAAIPSVVYGLWGFLFLENRATYVAHWIATYFGWIPLFKVDGAQPNDPLAPMTTYTASTFIAGMVVGLMITPIVSSMMRESFSQAPLGEREGAYALGATKWGMIRTVVLPFGRGGIIGGTMLGLGRALGETIAVYMIISLVFQIQPHILQAGASSVAALIAAHYGTATSFELSALMAAGLMLFLLTLAINLIASAVIARSRSGQESG